MKTAILILFLAIASVEAQTKTNSVPRPAQQTYAQKRAASIAWYDAQIAGIRRQMQPYLERQKALNKVANARRVAGEKYDDINAQLKPINERILALSKQELTLAARKAEYEAKYPPKQN